MFAEAVSTGTDGTKSVNYSALIAPLIEAVKEQQKDVGESPRHHPSWHDRVLDYSDDDLLLPRVSAPIAIRVARL